MSDSSTPDSTITKLKLISEIREFAIDSLGLHDSKNYTTFYDQQNKPLMWVVTGCMPYELKAKEWWFPVLGNVSYKGFFDPLKAKLEEEAIRREGYDTDVYSPSAWSTLGYFTDPILSNMLKRSPGRLAELIIHELTHATIYLESSVDFNENFATFVGEKGAELFLIHKFGSQSSELLQYRNFVEDENIYGNYMLQSAQLLDSLYSSFTPDMTVEQKAKQKYRTIASIMLRISKLPLHNKERYKFDFEKNTLPNNTEFMAYLRYRKNLDSFDSVFENQFNNDLIKLVSEVKTEPEILKLPSGEE